MKSCLVCDDHAMMREALAGAVRFGWPEAEVVQVGDFHAAAQAMATLRPDLCISDLVMPGGSPVEGIRSLRAAAPETPILVVTGDEREATLMAVLELGIAGFAPKTSKSDVVEAAIRLILAGGTYLPPHLAKIAVQTRGEEIRPALASRLTPRQHEVLQNIAMGNTTKEIARTLSLSPATVKAHTAAILLSLMAKNRVDAVHRAREMGLI